MNTKSWYKSEWVLGTLALVFIFGMLIGFTCLMRYAMRIDCTSDLEGVVLHPGKYGGYNRICHNGKWIPMKEKL